MEIDATDREPILFCVVVNAGMGNKILRKVEKIGVQGGTIFLGKGTVKSHILEVLGLNESKKEIVLIIAKKEIEDELHYRITERFNLEKPNHGIAFSLPVKTVLGARNYCTPTKKDKIGGLNKMAYDVIFTVVEKGMAEDVVDAATLAGSMGATIINARGSGIHEDNRFLAMKIEPEKEVIMIITEKEKTDNIISNINKTMQIEEPGKGIIFVLDVNKTSGLLKK